MASTITFYGGAGEVTGANFLLEVDGLRVLVDCGALERENMNDTTNLKSFPYDPSSIDYLIITHAHQDHIGRVPKLVHDGFRGVVYSTPATLDLSRLMFADAIKVMQTEAEHGGAPVMYEAADADAAISLWQTHAYHEPFELPEETSGVSVEFLDAGHILGSAMVRFSRGASSVVFTGDLGNSPEPLLNDTEPVAGAKYLVMESVYGDRVHEGRDERIDRLRGAIAATRAAGGVLLIPSFSIERTQVLLYEIDAMIERNEIEPIPAYLDAPLGIEVTELYRKYRSLLNPTAQSHFAENDGDPFVFNKLHVIKDMQESRAIHDAPSPKVIIAGAGMSSGGRIRAHEKRYLSDRNATILFVGYQAPGSLGRRIQDGAKHVEIDGTSVAIHARIETISGFSGHKDRDGLVSFVETAGSSLERVFVAMGEPKAELFLAQRLRDFFGVDAQAPEAGSSVAIDL